MRLSIPDFSLVVLIGPSGSGKSTFALRCFRPTEVVSSDACRALVADDETDQGATPAAFEVLRLIVAKRLEARRLTVIDATNVRAEDRRGLVELARAHYVLAVAIVFDIAEEVCQTRCRPLRDHRWQPVTKRLGGDVLFVERSRSGHDDGDRGSRAPPANAADRHRQDRRPRGDGAGSRGRR